MEGITKTFILLIADFQYQPRGKKESTYTLVQQPAFDVMCEFARKNGMAVPDAWVLDSLEPFTIEVIPFHFEFHCYFYSYRSSTQYR